MTYYYMEKIVSRFGKRGAHINLPADWIGKKVVVKLLDDSHMTTSLNNTKSHMTQAIIPVVSYDNQIELDEEEQDFLDKYKNTSPTLRSMLELHASKQFGKERTKQIIHIL